MERMWKAGEIRSLQAGDRGYQTALHHAAHHGQKEVCDWLLGQGASLNIQDLSGHTPVRNAIDSLHVGLVEHLVSRGADLFIRSRNDYCAIHALLFPVLRLKRSEIEAKRAGTPRRLALLAYLEKAGLDCRRLKTSSWTDKSTGETTEYHDSILGTALAGKADLELVQWAAARLSVDTWTPEEVEKEVVWAFDLPSVPAVLDWAIDTFGSRCPESLLYMAVGGGQPEPVLRHILGLVPEERHADAASRCLAHAVWYNARMLPFLLEKAGKTWSDQVEGSSFTVLGLLWRAHPDMLRKLSAHIKSFNVPLLAGGYESGDSLGLKVAGKRPDLLPMMVAKGLDINAGGIIGNHAAPALLVAAARHPLSVVLVLLANGATPGTVPEGSAWSGYGMVEMALFNPDVEMWEHVSRHFPPTRMLGQAVLSFTENPGKIPTAMVEARVRCLLGSGLSLLDRPDGLRSIAFALLDVAPLSILWMREDESFQASPLFASYVADALQIVLAKEQRGEMQEGSFLQLWQSLENPLPLVRFFSGQAAEIVKTQGPCPVFDEIRGELMLAGFLPPFDPASWQWWNTHARTSLGDRVLAGVAWSVASIQDFWVPSAILPHQKLLELRLFLRERVVAGGGFVPWQNTNGTTWLHHALSQGLPGFQAAFEKMPFLLPCRDSAGQTVFHWLKTSPLSAWEGLFFWLCEKGLDPFVGDNQDQNAFDLIDPVSEKKTSRLFEWHQAFLNRQHLGHVLPSPSAPVSRRQDRI